MIDLGDDTLESKIHKKMTDESTRDSAMIFTGINDESWKLELDIWGNPGGDPDLGLPTWVTDRSKVNIYGKVFENNVRSCSTRF